MASYLSLLLYVLTFIFGFWLDSPAYRNNTKARRLYVIWLYIFLCFGYMTGSDWRNFETEFYDWNSIFNKDYGYVYTINFLHHFIGDFWIIYDGFRCLYLFSVIVILKKLTPYWLTAISFLVSMSLLTLTIDTPFRFMIALTFLNFAILLIWKSKYIIAISLCAIAATFHGAIILVIPFVFLVKTSFLLKLKNWILILLYILVVVFTANLDRITGLQIIVGLFLADHGFNSYSSYEAESGVNFLTFGLVLQIFVFVFVIITKSIVANKTNNGSIIANMAILGFYVSRFVIAIPTGHRLGWLFDLFLAVFFANLFCIKGCVEKQKVIDSTRNWILRNIRVLFLILVIYYGTTMTKTIVNHFAYIPYSNSIPYIIIGHKPYNERIYYNLKAYQQRTGKKYELNTDDYQY